MEKVFKVKGMHCKSCEMLITDALSDIDVKVIEISSSIGTVKVKFDDSKITESKIKTIIENEGYKVVS